MAVVAIRPTLPIIFADKNNKLPLETILQPQGRSPRYFLSHANKEKNVLGIKYSEV